MAGSDMDERKKILLIDTDPERSHYVINFVPLLGNYDLEKASNSLEVLAKINAFEPELIILNPETPGLEIPRILREIREKHPQTKLVTVKPSSNLTDLSREIKSLLPPLPEQGKSADYARLLVVDDEPGMHALFEDIFQPLGIEVYGAADAEEALRVFKEKLCNLAVVDLRLPKISGAELVKQLEKSTDPPSPKVLMIMTTALGNSRQELSSLGHPVLMKPLDPDLLEENILAACRKFGLKVKKSD